MNRLFSQAAAAFLALLASAPLAYPEDEHKPAETKAKAKKVVVIPVRTAIDKPALYILRRALKDAISNEVDTVVIDMKTPGGRLDVTLDIMEALDRFPGKKITYINDEATSAGAIISSVTDEIYFSPRATMGAAEVVSGSGQDIGKSMKRKINSYMNSKIRAYTEKTPLRAEVIRSMMDPEYEFKIEETVIKKKGELLSLTATEAVELHGEPPSPLLAQGIVENVTELLDDVHGKGNYTVQRYEPSWSEDLAQWITTITPALLAFGLLGVFIEFKTPGFGIFGVVGLILLAIVFTGHRVAGLSGYEPMLLLLLGLVLIAVELFVLPGTIIFGISGAILVFSSLIWAMLDIWPDQPLNIDSDMLMGPLVNLTLGVAGAVVLFVAMLRFLPGKGPWGGMVLQTAVAGEPTGIHPVHAPKENGAAQTDLVGAQAVAATDLYPSGQVTIKGKRYEARVEVGSIDAGTEVVVTELSGFGLIVAPKEPNKGVTS